MFAAVASIRLIRRKSEIYMERGEVLVIAWNAEARPIIIVMINVESRNYRTI